MKLIPYFEYLENLPLNGRHIVGTYTKNSVTVYQEFNKSIAQYAVRNGRFGPPFSFDRLSWIKPNFTWMMYRSDWGQANDCVLAIRIRREFFELVLEKAVYSQFFRKHYSTPDKWRKTLKESDVVIQWDPDHDPKGKSLPRRAIQLGLSGEMLRLYAGKAIIEIKDISEVVRRLRPFAQTGNFKDLKVPEEAVYLPKSQGAIEYLEIDSIER